MSTPRPRFRPSALDLATIPVLALATYMLVRPGSALYAAGSQRVAQWRFERAIARDWETLTAAAQPLYTGGGGPDAIVFADYECPYCRQAHPVLDSAVNQGMRISIIQFPLAIHANAKPAARAALCAVKLGSFRSVDRYLMTTTEWQKDTTRLGSPSVLGISDSAGYVRCMKEDQTAELLASNIAISDSVGVSGTPMIVTRKRLLRRPPSVAAIRELMSEGGR